MTEQPGRGGLGPANSSETVGDRGTAGVGGDGATSDLRTVGTGAGVGAVGDRGTGGRGRRRRGRPATAGPPAPASGAASGPPRAVSVGGTLGDRGEDERTQLRAVMRDFGPAWEIERVPPGAAWVAVTRRGSWVHVIAAHDLDTLRTKIESSRARGNPARVSPITGLTAAAGVVINRLVLPEEHQLVDHEGRPGGLIPHVTPQPSS